MRGLVVLAAAPALIAGCSMRSTYDRLDWIIPAYVDDYITLDTEQRALLWQRLDAQLHWHRSEQLPRYACWLRQVNYDVRHGLTPEKLERHNAQLRQAWATLVRRLAPDTAQLLASTSDAQFLELRANLERKTKEYKSEYVDPPEQTLRARRAARMQKRLRRWIGPLTAQQVQTVNRWSERIELTGMDILAARRRWPAKLDRLRSQRQEPARMAETIERLVLRTETDRTVEYRHKGELNRRLTGALLIDIAEQLSPGQRHQLQARISELARDLEQLTGLSPLCRSVPPWPAPAEPLCSPGLAM